MFTVLKIEAKKDDVSHEAKKKSLARGIKS